MAMDDNAPLYIMESSDDDEADIADSPAKASGIEASSSAGDRPVGRMIVKGFRDVEGSFVVQKGTPARSDDGQCALCLKVMKDRRSLLKHERKEHDPGEFPCWLHQDIYVQRGSPAALTLHGARHLEHVP